MHARALPHYPWIWQTRKMGVFIKENNSMQLSLGALLFLSFGKQMVLCINFGQFFTMHKVVCAVHRKAHWTYLNAPSSNSFSSASYSFDLKTKSKQKNALRTSLPFVVYFLFFIFGFPELNFCPLQIHTHTAHVNPEQWTKTERVSIVVCGTTNL